VGSYGNLGLDGASYKAAISRSKHARSTVVPRPVCRLVVDAVIYCTLRHRRYWTHIEPCSVMLVLSPKYLLLIHYPFFPAAVLTRSPVAAASGHFHGHFPSDSAAGLLEVYRRSRHTYMLLTVLLRGSLTPVVCDTN